MEKTFADVQVGEKFNVNGDEYIKIDEIKISCCRSINCYNSSDSSQKGFFPADTVVVVNG